LNVLPLISSAERLGERPKPYEDTAAYAVAVQAASTAKLEDHPHGRVALADEGLPVLAETMKKKGEFWGVVLVAE